MSTILQLKKKRKTQRALVYRYQFLPEVASCKIIVYYHNQDIDIDTIHDLIQIFPVLLILVPLYKMLFRTAFLQPHPLRLPEHLAIQICSPFLENVVI